MSFSLSLSVEGFKRRAFAVLLVLFLHAQALRGLAISLPVTVPAHPFLSAKDIMEVFAGLKELYPTSFSGLFHSNDPAAVMKVVNDVRCSLEEAGIDFPVIENAPNRRGYRLHHRVVNLAVPALALLQPPGKSQGA